MPSTPLSILLYPDPRLRARARPIGPSDAERVRALIPAMLATMYAAPGIGLAAPQIGELLRLIVVDVGEGERPDPLIAINPEIVARSAETVSREEGCLSLPGQYAAVTRPACIRLRYQEADGSRREITAEGLLAACLQHEIDHLDGVLFIDHVSPLRRNMLLRRYAKEQRLKRRA